MSRMVVFFKTYRWAILSGVLMGTSYIPFPPWALAFCWAPLWWDLLRQPQTPKQAFFKGWWTQFLLTLIGFHWIAYVAHEFGYLPWSASTAVLLVFATVVHLYIPLAAALTVYLKNRFRLSIGPSLFLIATLQNLGETYWPSVFSWNLGYPLLWIQAPWVQWADVIGFLGLSYAMHLIQALVTWLWFRRDAHQAVLSLSALVVFLVLTGLGAYWRKAQWPAGSRTVKALIVQANIGNLEKVYAERGAGYQREIIQKYFDLSRDGLTQHPETELLVFPESAIPEFLDDHNRNRRYAGLFFAGVQGLGKSIVTGSYSNDPPDTNPRNDYNSLFVLNENGQVLGQAYHKTNLLMFGEYVPLGDWFPVLRKWNPGGEGFGRGSGPIVIDWNGKKIGPQICYESLEPGFSARLATLGADFLINITNDSWFGPRFEPEQHAYMTLARALETRRPLLRSTNTGITTAIEADGTILEQSPKFQEWSGLFEIKLPDRKDLTFYTLYGAFLPLLQLLVLGLVLRGRRGASRLD